MKTLTEYINESLVQMITEAFKSKKVKQFIKSCQEADKNGHIWAYSPAITYYKQHFFPLAKFDNGRLRVESNKEGYGGIGGILGEIEDDDIWDKQENFSLDEVKQIYSLNEKELSSNICEYLADTADKVQGVFIGYSNNHAPFFHKYESFKMYKVLLFNNTVYQKINGLFKKMKDRNDAKKNDDSLLFNGLNDYTKKILKKYKETHSKEQVNLLDNVIKYVFRNTKSNDDNSIFSKAFGNSDEWLKWRKKYYGEIGYGKDEESDKKITRKMILQNKIKLLDDTIRFWLSDEFCPMWDNKVSHFIKSNCNDEEKQQFKETWKKLHEGDKKED